MALTSERVLEFANHGKSLANEAKALHYKIKQFLTSNSNVAIAWTDDPKPAYINEDVAGNIDGVGFTRAQMSNLIGSLDSLRKTLDNEVVAQGDYLGNINQVASSDA